MRRWRGGDIALSGNLPRCSFRLRVYLRHAAALRFRRCCGNACRARENGGRRGGASRSAAFLARFSAALRVRQHRQRLPLLLLNAAFRATARTSRTVSRSFMALARGAGRRVCPTHAHTCSHWLLFPALSRHALPLRNLSVLGAFMQTTSSLCLLRLHSATGKHAGLPRLHAFLPVCAGHLFRLLAEKKKKKEQEKALLRARRLLFSLLGMRRQARRIEL